MILTYQSQKIQQRDQDNFVSLTQMAKANKVEVSNWLRLEGTKNYIQALEADLHICRSELLIVNKGGVTNQQGTWSHPLIAIAFAQWISPQFHIWCNKHIKILLETGKTEVQQQKPKTALELAKEQVALLERLELQEQIIADQEQDLLRQAEVIDELFDYSSIIRIAKYNNVHEKSFNWRVLKAASIKMNLEIKKVPDPNFVTKNLYSHDVWRFAYPNVKLPDTTTLVINN